MLHGSKTTISKRIAESTELEGCVFVTLQLSRTAVRLSWVVGSRVYGGAFPTRVMAIDPGSVHLTQPDRGPIELGPCVFVTTQLKRFGGPIELGGQATRVRSTSHSRVAPHSLPNSAGPRSGRVGGMGFLGWDLPVFFSGRSQKVFYCGNIIDGSKLSPTGRVHA